MSSPLWITDPHLNFVSDGRRSELLQEIHDWSPSAVLIGGDIAEATSFDRYLREFATELDCPICFVLGNHDYYHGTIPQVRQSARQLMQEWPQLRWLPESGPVPLSDGSLLVGHGGWGDARAGDFDTSTILLNDYLLIQDLRSAQLEELLNRETNPDPRAVLNDWLRERLRQLGDDAATSLRSQVSNALAQAESVTVLMHVPPFREACWYAGKTSDDNWAPHFVCQAAGVVLRELMSAAPDQHMTVLCGHCHGEGTVDILPNLRVLTGAAEYGAPAIQTLWPDVT